MLFTLEIEGKERTFNFGMKFVREIDALNVIEVDNGVKQKVGLTYALAGVVSKEPQDIANILYYGSKCAGENLTQAEIDAYIEDAEDFDKLCGDLESFFAKSNCTRTTMTQVQEQAAHTLEVQKIQREREKTIARG